MKVKTQSCLKVSLHKNKITGLGTISLTTPQMMLYFILSLHVNVIRKFMAMRTNKDQRCCTLFQEDRSEKLFFSLLFSYFKVHEKKELKKPAPPQFSSHEKKSFVQTKKRLYFFHFKIELVPLATAN